FAVRTPHRGKQYAQRASHSALEVLIMRFLTRPLSVLLAAMMAIAQQTPPAQAPAQSAGGTVKFQASTQLVIETVTVKDKNGKPIEGLTAKDFTITEDGVAQTIAFCEYQK